MTHEIAVYDEETFAGLVEGADNSRPVLVNFSAEHRCAPCRSLAQVLDAFADEYGDRIDVVKLDVDASRDVAIKYKIRGIPTLKLFLGGEVLDTRLGTLSFGALKQFVNGHCPLDDAGNDPKANALDTAI